MQLTILFEEKSPPPSLERLKEYTIKLTDDERKEVMDANAIWHHGKNGTPSPAIRKAEIGEKIYYYSATHRCYQVDVTLKAAIKSFFDTVKPSS